MQSSALVSARKGLEWIFEELARDCFQGVRLLGTLAVSIFFEAWLGAPPEGEGGAECAGELEVFRAAALQMALACLGVLEGDVEAVEPPAPSALQLVELMRMLWFRSELRPGEPADFSARTAQRAAGVPIDLVPRLAVAVNSTSTAAPGLRKDADDARTRTVGRRLAALRDGHTWELARTVLPAELCRLRLDSRSGPNLEPVRVPWVGLKEGFQGLLAHSFAWPGSRNGRNLNEVCGDDLAVAAGIAQALSTCSLAASRDTAPWLFDLARETTSLLLAAGQPDTSDNVARGLDILLSFVRDDGTDPLIQSGRAWLLQLASPEGWIGAAPDSIPGAQAQNSSQDSLRILARVQPTWLAVRALRPRATAARPERADRSALYEELATKARAGLEEAGFAPGPLQHHALLSECYLGVPDGSLGAQVAVEKPSAIGGPRGRGLFVEGPGRPAPLELCRDLDYGTDGFLSDEEVQGLHDEEDENRENVVWITLSAWFRDEFSSGALHGQVRPLAAAVPQWLAEGRCVQDITWDERLWEYALPSEGGRVAFVSPSISDNPAAMANDVLYMTCASESEYNVKDRLRNNMVMVPCARPTEADPEKLEFSSVWLYPRWGWRWDGPQELTLGYGWDDPSEVEDEVNSVALAAASA